MNTSKMLSFAFALGLAAVLGACGAQSANTNTPAQGTEAAGAAANTAGLTRVDLDNSSDPTTVKVSVEEGKSLLVLSNLSAGEATVKISKDGNWTMDDYLFEGYGVSSAGGPGAFEATIEPDAATGVVYLIPYDDSNIDFVNSDAEQLYNEILANAS